MKTAQSWCFKTKQVFGCWFRCLGKCRACIFFPCDIHITDYVIPNLNLHKPWPHQRLEKLKSNILGQRKKRILTMDLLPPIWFLFRPGLCLMQAITQSFARWSSARRSWVWTQIIGEGGVEAGFDIVRWWDQMWQRRTGRDTSSWLPLHQRSCDTSAPARTRSRESRSCSVDSSFAHVFIRTPAWRNAAFTIHHICLFT